MWRSRSTFPLSTHHPTPQHQTDQGRALLRFAAQPLVHGTRTIVWEKVGAAWVCECLAREPFLIFPCVLWWCVWCVRVCISVTLVMEGDNHLNMECSRRG